MLIAVKAFGFKTLAVMMGLSTIANSSMVTFADEVIQPLVETTDVVAPDMTSSEIASLDKGGAEGGGIV